MKILFLNITWILVFVSFLSSTEDGKQFAYFDQDFEIGSIHYMPVITTQDGWVIESGAASHNRKVMDSVYTFLQLHPSFKIQIEHYTDYRGNDDFNLSLSQARCKSIVHYLVERGIDPIRLHAKGFGEKHLLVSKEQAERETDLKKRESLIGKNRRTLLRIIEN
ncbi:MAG: OmpA family protein [Bacteroidetes bacterium]|nr:OmpA family protein [Bacteroidota bacterium]